MEMVHNDDDDDVDDVDVDDSLRPLKALPKRRLSFKKNLFLTHLPGQSIANTREWMQPNS